LCKGGTGKKFGGGAGYGGKATGGRGKEKP